MALQKIVVMSLLWSRWKKNDVTSNFNYDYTISSEIDSSHVLYDQFISALIKIFLQMLTYTTFEIMFMDKDMWIKFNIFIVYFSMTLYLHAGFFQQIAIINEYLHLAWVICVCIQPMREAFHCNVVSHWLGAYTKLSLILYHSLTLKYCTSPVYTEGSLQDCSIFSVLEMEILQSCIKALTYSLSRLLMTWWHHEPGHQQPWHTQVPDCQWSNTECYG